MAAITDLSSASSVGASDYLVISQSGTDKKVTADKLAILSAANTFAALATFSAGIANASITPAGASMTSGNIQALSNFTSITNGVIIVLDTSGTQYAIFSVKGGANSTQEMLDPNNTFSATADTASSINIYYSSGYKIQNNRAYTTTLRVLGIGA